MGMQSTNDLLETRRRRGESQEDQGTEQCEDRWAKTDQAPGIEKRAGTTCSGALAMKSTDSEGERRPLRRDGLPDLLQERQDLKVVSSLRLPSLQSPKSTASASKAKSKDIDKLWKSPKTKTTRQRSTGRPA